HTPTHQIHSFPTRRSSDLKSQIGLSLMPSNLKFMISDLRCRIRPISDSPCHLLFSETLVAFPGWPRSVYPSASLMKPSDRSFVRSEEHTSELQSPDHLVCR